MTRGRKPTPTALKKLRGNPGKRALPKGEPKPAVDPAMGEPSDWLNRVAKAEWRRMAGEMMKVGTLTKVDRAAFEGYCVAYSRWVKAEEYIEKHGMTVEMESGYVQQRAEVSIAQKYLQKVREFASEFGMTPASRTRIKIETDGEQADPYGDFLKDRPRPSAALRPDAAQAGTA